MITKAHLRCAGSFRGAASRASCVVGGRTHLLRAVWVRGRTEGHRAGVGGWSDVAGTPRWVDITNSGVTAIQATLIQDLDACGMTKPRSSEVANQDDGKTAACFGGRGWLVWMGGSVLGAFSAGAYCY